MKYKFNKQEQEVKNQDRIKSIIGKLLEQIENGQIVEKIAQTYLKGQKIPSDNWSLLNKIIMTVENTQDARTFLQWKEVNRSVKKGSKAIYIIKPVKITKKEIDENTKQEVSRQILIGFAPLAVFRYEDTEGQEFKRVEEPKLLPTFETMAKNLNVTLSIKTSHHGEYGSYNPIKDHISLASGDPNVFFHELVHAAHNRIEKLKGGQDVKQEIIADFSSVVLCNMYNIENENNKYLGSTVKYIKGYIQSNDNKQVIKEISKVISTIEKVLDIILQVNKPEQIKPLLVKVK